MKFVIRANRHHAFPPPLGIYFKRRAFRKRVRFSASCRYELPGVDHYDTNKIFGIGFGSPWLMLRYFFSTLWHWAWDSKPTLHHVDSARFGWRYDRVNDRISLYAYCYVNGEKSIRHITCVPLERDVDLLIFLDYNHQYWFEVKMPHNPFFSPRSYSLPFSHKKKWKYALGFFFGGNRKAPHRMTAHFKNLPS